MTGMGFMSQMISSNRINRALQQKNWRYFNDKSAHISERERIKDYSGKVFNELFLEEDRAEVIENRKRLSVEMANIQWENKVKTLTSFVITGILVLFCLMKWWI